MRSLDDVLRRTRASLTDPDTERTVRSILDDVERRGEPAVRHHAERLGDLERGDPWMLEAEALERAADALAPDTRALVERVRDRVEDFARAQLDTVTELDTTVLAGRAGHRLIPVERVGCYAPGGRYPLPSSVLMAVVPARVAGVAEVSVASPNPDPITLAAAHIAGADRLIAVGGAQAIAAMAYGAGDLRACDIVVGPGNRFVAVAKRQVSGRVGIDMTAGPSELLVIASSDASPERIAADLLAQAEHDPDAVPVLCALPGVDVEAVRDALAAQLETLPTREVATASLRQGATLMADGPDDAIRIAEAIAPEHLQTQGAEASSLAERLDRHGALFVNGETPEVVGDYGVGPNHTLPTGGGAAFESGLSPLTFLRRPTWIDLDPDAAGYEDVMRDSAAFARLEGLEAHARSAEARLR